MLADAGFEIVPHVLGEGDVRSLITSLEKPLVDEQADAVRAHAGRQYALRDLFNLVPAVRELAASAAVLKLIEPVLGASARPVRGILFDKTPGANWKVAWHQDLSIAVREQRDAAGYGPWSVKAGVPHVQPPVGVLDSMLTVRLHLDECTADNGPLQVLPGSHAKGVLSPDAVRAWRKRVPPEVCLVPAGGALLMRPLILHASSASVRPAHRRVVHIEYASATLADGLEWHEGDVRAS